MILPLLNTHCRPRVTRMGLREKASPEPYSKISDRMYGARVRPLSQDPYSKNPRMKSAEGREGQAPGHKELGLCPLLASTRSSWTYYCGELPQPGHGACAQLPQKRPRLGRNSPTILSYR